MCTKHALKLVHESYMRMVYSLKTNTTDHRQQTKVWMWSYAIFMLLLPFYYYYYFIISLKVGTVQNNNLPWNIPKYTLSLPNTEERSLSSARNMHLVRVFTCSCRNWVCVYIDEHTCLCVCICRIKRCSRWHGERFKSHLTSLTRNRRLSSLVFVH